MTYHGLVVPLHVSVSAETLARKYNQEEYDQMVFQHVLTHKYASFRPEHMSNLMKTLQLGPLVQQCAVFVAVLRALVALEHALYEKYKVKIPYLDDKTMLYVNQEPRFDYAPYVRAFNEDIHQCDTKTGLHDQAVFRDLFMTRNKLLGVNMQYSNIAKQYPEHKQSLFQVTRNNAKQDDWPLKYFAYVLLDSSYTYLGHVYMWPHNRFPFSLDVIGIRTSIHNLLCQKEKQIGAKLFYGVLQYAQRMGKKYISVSQPLSKMPHVLRQLGFAQGAHQIYWGHVDSCLVFAQRKKSLASFRLELFTLDCARILRLKIDPKRLQILLDRLTTHDIEQDYIREYFAFLLDQVIANTGHAQEGNLFLEKKVQDKSRQDILAAWYHAKTYFLNVLKAADNTYAYKRSVFEMMYAPQKIINHVHDVTKRLKILGERLAKMKDTTQDTYLDGADDATWAEFVGRVERTDIEFTLLQKELQDAVEQAQQLDTIAKYKRPLSKLDK